MSVPNKVQVRHVVQVLLVLALLVMIVNPELRVLVLLIRFGTNTSVISIAAAINV